MYFYFPIEIQSRELPTRLAVALRLVNDGNKVIICDQKILEKNIQSLPPGMIFHKDTSDCNAGKLFMEAKKFGHGTSALDEEGLVYFSESAYKKSRLGKNTLINTDLIFCWGPAQKNIIDSIGLKYSKLVLSGHPKFEIQRNVSSSNGSYYLINTRFGSVNNGLVDGVDEYIKRMRLVDEVKDFKDEFFRRNYFLFMKNLLEQFIQLISYLADAFPDERFLIRPHPVESRAIYDELAIKNSNVNVSDKGSDLEQDIKNAKAIIHNGCTTGIEALAMNKPVFIYDPIKTPEGDMALPNKFGVINKNIESLHSSILKFKELNYDWDSALDGVENFISNFRNNSPSKIIAENLQKHAPNISYNYPSIQLNTKPSFINAIVAKLPKIFSKGFIYNRQKAIEYSDNKNPDLTLNEFINKVEEIQITLNDISNVSINKLGNKSYIIEKCT